MRNFFDRLKAFFAKNETLLNFFCCGGWSTLGYIVAFSLGSKVFPAGGKILMAVAYFAALCTSVFFAFCAMRAPYLISYVNCGGLATLINIGVFLGLYNALGVQNVPANALAWLAACAFAFFTNKFLVFESATMRPKEILREAAMFLFARLGTGVIDIAIMFVAVDKMHLNATFWKIIANIVVIVLNFILSKIFVFKKAEQ